MVHGLMILCVISIYLTSRLHPVSDYSEAVTVLMVYVPFSVAGGKMDNEDHVC